MGPSGFGGTGRVKTVAKLASEDSNLETIASVGSNKSEYIDFMKLNYPPHFTYADFAPKFTAEFYDPLQWADIFKNSGAKY